MSMAPDWAAAAIESRATPPTWENLPIAFPGPGPKVAPPSVDTAHQMPRSAPRMKTSSRFAAKPAVAVGPAVSTPPRDVKEPNVPLVSLICQRAASLPSTKTAVLVAEVDAAPGVATVSPPRDVQPPKVSPLTVLDHRTLLPPRTKTSCVVAVPVVVIPPFRTPPKVSRD